MPAAAMGIATRIDQIGLRFHAIFDEQRLRVRHLAEGGASRGDPGHGDIQVAQINLRLGESAFAARYQGEIIQPVRSLVRILQEGILFLGKA